MAFEQPSILNALPISAELAAGAGYISINLTIPQSPVFFGAPPAPGKIEIFFDATQVPIEYARLLVEAINSVPALRVAPPALPHAPQPDTP